MQPYADLEQDPRVGKGAEWQATLGNTIEIIIFFYKGRKSNSNNDFTSLIVTHVAACLLHRVCAVRKAG